MYAFSEIVILPSIQRIAECLRRQLNLMVGILSSAGDLIWLGTHQNTNHTPCEHCPHLSACSRPWLEKLIQNPTSSMFMECTKGFQTIAVPVFENKQCNAAVFAMCFSNGKETCENVISRREALIAIDMLMEIASEIQENAPTLRQNRESAEYNCDFSSIIGSSLPTKSLLNHLELACHNDAPVYIQGQPGTGKSLIARTIHLNSPRRTSPFIQQDCSALTDSQLEAELFGHKRGAFSGSLFDRPGLLDVANGGSLLLQEVHSLSPSLQLKLLKLLEYGSFLPIGDTIPHTVNIRIFASSSQNLEACVAQGTFRQDLFYRLSPLTISVPTLAERREDIPELSSYLMSKYSQLHKMPEKQLAPDTLDILCGYDWPGNITELENELQRLIIISSNDEMITQDKISPRIIKTQAVKRDAIAAVSAVEPSASLLDHFTMQPGQTLQDALDEIERRMITLTLEQNDGNRTKAADILGISRRNLIRKIESLDIHTTKT